MKLKKFLAGVCTGALALSLAIPAFATTPAALTNPTKTEFEGDTGANLTVSVSVKASQTPKLYVNPYGMSYTPADITIGDIVIKGSSTAAGFFSDTALIENKSTSQFGVKVTLTTKSAANVAIVATEPVTDPTDNTMFGHFEIADATLTDGTVTPDWTAAKQVVIPAISAASGGTAGTATSTTYTRYILDAGTETPDAMSGGTKITPAYAAFRLTGKSYVGTTGNVWNDNDLVDVAVAFSFIPPAYDITANEAVGAVNGGAYIVDKTYAAAGETVTITVTPDTTNTNTNVSVTDADGTTVTATQGTGAATNDYTFTMPAKAVEIDVTFST